jgi:histidyl-tRNA synthetase
MTPEVTKIGNKLFDKVELASYKIELGLIDEISKELTNAFNSQDVETEINNAVAKLQKSLPIYKSVVVKCDEALAKIKDLGITGGVDKQVLEQKNEANSYIKSIENRISNLSKLRK